ncbi:MAG: response regulator transcription factor [bacterium]
MSHLSTGDYERAMQLLGRVYACGDPDELPHVAIDGLHALIGGHRVSFEYIAPTVPEFWGIAHPYLDYRPDMWQIFAEQLHEHPAVQHHLRTGDQSAYCLADFVSASDWERTGMYQRLLRDVGGQEQLAATLSPRGGSFYGMIVWREKRTFTERDRAMFNLVRPHIARAYETAQTMTRIKQNLALHERVRRHLHQWIVPVDADGRVRDMPPAAEQMLKRYFSERAFARGGLPEPVERWRQRADAPASPLTRQDGDDQLVLRWVPEPNAPEDGGTLLIEQRTTASGAAALRRMGLTARETEVLLQIEQGKTNRQIAAAMFISPATVKKHLENIYEKLNVDHRTAALAKMRRAR